VVLLARFPELLRTPEAIRAGDLIRRAYLGAVSDRGT